MKSLTLGFVLLLGACGTHEMDPGRSPEHAGRHRGPPPEAKEACKDKDDGDPCNVKRADRTISGTCEARSDTDPLACHPDGGPPDRPKS